MQREKDVKEKQQHHCVVLHDSRFNYNNFYNG